MRLPQFQFPPSAKLVGTGILMINPTATSEFKFHVETDADGELQTFSTGRAQEIPIGGFDVIEMTNEQTGEKCRLGEMVVRGRQPGWGPVVQDRDADVIHWTVVGNDTALLERLLEGGYDPHYRHARNGASALHYAAGIDNLEAAKMLLRYGADPLFEDNNGISCMQVAEMEGSRNVLDLFRNRINESE